jgi:hypothetical protein
MQLLTICTMLLPHSHFTFAFLPCFPPSSLPPALPFALAGPSRSAQTNEATPCAEIHQQSKVL